MSKDTKSPIDKVLEPKKLAANLEQWIKENNKIVVAVITVIILIPICWFGYQKYIKGPKEKEAYAAMFPAEQFFAQERWQEALDGGPDFSGFITIADDYSGTKAGNLSHYYAGICYLRLGNYAEAIEHLEDFSCDDILLNSVALGALGDAYRETGDSEKAVKNYEKAANAGPNNFTSPIYLKKAGLTYEDDLQNLDKALACFEKIEKEYPNSREGQEAMKYIMQIKAQKAE